jgi:hypothetical protein
MTPLATELFEDRRNLRIIPPENWTEARTGQFVRDVRMRAKFFEMSAVIALAVELAAKTMSFFECTERVDTRLAFLPAELTWLEWDAPWEGLGRSYKAAHILRGMDGSTKVAERFSLCHGLGEPPRVWKLAQLPPLGLVNSGLKPRWSKEYTTASGTKMHLDIEKPDLNDFIDYALLALINTPRIIGRRQHMPHERIEREKLKRLGLVGKYPLRAWTEILLTVAPPTIGGDESHEAHLTGEKCLHFCRTHVRVRYGQIEYVEGHWRGNPALGMKQSRYRLEQGK